MNFGGSTSEEDSFQIMAKAVEGVDQRILRMYTKGESERNHRQVLKENNLRGLYRWLLRCLAAGRFAT